MSFDDDDPFDAPGLFDWTLPPEARQVLIEGLRSDDRAARREAVGMLWDSMDDELAQEALRLAHEDPDAEIAAMAAIALAPALRAAGEAGLTGSPLSEAGRTAVVDGLRRLYHESRAPTEVRRRALEAAIHGPGSWQEGAVRAAWAGGDPDWRATAVFCMGHLPGFADEIGAALADTDPGVQFEAARAAAGAGLDDAGPTVLALAGDTGRVPEVRIAAVQALMTLRPPGTEEILREIAAEGEGDVAEVAAEALADLADEAEDLEEI